MTITYHRHIEQGSAAWFKLRTGILTASEMRLVISQSGGGTGKSYFASGATLGKCTPAREQALGKIGEREGSIAELALIAGVSDGVIRAMLKDGAIGFEDRPIPISLRYSSDDKCRSHLWELLAQRITGHVEETFESWDILRGREDEIEARLQYSQRYAPVEECGFITNNRWGFTLGFSPDGLVGDDGLIECKSRKQKYQVETIVECAAANTIPAEFMLQCQTALLVSERKWIDFISYSGGLPMSATRVFPDPTYEDAIIAAAQRFEADLADKRTIYDAMIASGARLIPTERSDREQGDIRV